MSRIGQKPIVLPKEVKITLDGNIVTVMGPKGQLSQLVRPEVKVLLTDGLLHIERKQETKLARSLHGLTRTLVANMVMGVCDGWLKTLELVGVGYRAQKQGENIVLSVGFSHPVVITPPQGIQLQVTEGKIVVSGIDKSLVGQMAATIRDVRPPEPYKGKGIRYLGELVRTKPGKTAKVAGGTGDK